MSITYTEFYCDPSAGNQMNGGSDSGSASYTATNGNWSTTTHNYTPTNGTTPASSVTVGQFAQVFIDGATTPVYVARVTAVAAGVNGAITLSSTAISGTAPTTLSTTRSIRVGGAWKGPNGASGFPFSLVTGTLLPSPG